MDTTSLFLSSCDIFIKGPDLETILENEENDTIMSFFLSLMWKFAIVCEQGQNNCTTVITYTPVESAQVHN